MKVHGQIPSPVDLMYLHRLLADHSSALSDHCSVLTFPHSRARSGVARPRGRIGPEQAGIIGLVGSRERNERTGSTGAPSRQVDLTTGHVQLGSSRLLSQMQRDTLHPNEVFSAGHIGWDLEAHLRLVYICGGRGKVP